MDLVLLLTWVSRENYSSMRQREVSGVRKTSGLYKLAISIAKTWGLAAFVKPQPSIVTLLSSHYVQ